MTSTLALQASAAVGGLLSRVFYATRASRFPAREAAFQSLMRSQWLSADALRDQQWRDLQALLAHAWANVPYYREVFDRLGARPEDIRGEADLARLPLLTKTIIQEQGDRLKARDLGAIPGVYRNHTGGSTGTPLSFWQDANYFAWGMAELDRNFRMTGYRPGWRQAFLWGSDYDSRAHVGFKGRLHDLILNLRWYNTFAIRASDVRRIADELVRFRPHLLVGYVSSLTMLATLIREQGLQAPRPRAIQTSAEVLTPDARTLLEDVFQSRCFDRYGCREVGNVAHECDAHDGLHLLVESSVVEFVPSADDPGTRQIVVTNVRNHAMPFIRYATGDTGTPLGGAAPCACGRGLPRMRNLNGRVSDVIVAPGGRFIHGEFFTHLFYGAEGVRQFQVEQVTVPELVVRVAASSTDAFAAIRDKVQPLILEHGDPAFLVRWEQVDHIPPAASGKYRFTLSRVPLTARPGVPAGTGAR